MTLTNALEKLPSDQFLRIHKSYIISLSKIDSIEGNRVNIKNTSLPIGRNYRIAFINKIESLRPFLRIRPDKISSNHS